jgi:class 3 adenylate cyclase
MNNPEDVGRRLSSIQEIIDAETHILDQQVSITQRNKIPGTDEIPLINSTNWLQIPDVIACFVDMEGSTKLSATAHPATTAKAYRYFTNTAIRIYNEFDATYIDVRGDGVFALFDGDRVHTALAATVTFKDFVTREFTPRIQKLTGLNIGGHFGIDRKSVLVRRLGLKIVGGNNHRQNEVWAGKPINMAAKLASRSSNGKLWVSKRFHDGLWGENALLTCGCDGHGTPSEKTPLWREESVEGDDRFDFDVAYILTSNWCAHHGKAVCRSILKYDDDKPSKRR